MTTMTKTMAESIATLVSAGLSVEDAVKAVTLLGEAKTTTKKAQPKAESKATKAAQPKAETGKVEKVGGITRVKAQPKAESKSKTTATAKPNAENGKALMLNCKFNIEQATRTDDPSVKVWRVSLAERVAKSDWADLSRYFGAEFDAGYWRGAWTFCFDPSKVLAGGEMTAKQSKAVEERKAERKAAREAKRAAKKSA